MTFSVVPIAEKHIDGLRNALDSVARDRNGASAGDAGTLSAWG